MKYILLILAITYLFLLHKYKDRVNEWLDINAPKWYTQCNFCRGFHFGVIEGFLLATIIYLAL